MRLSIFGLLFLLGLAVLAQATAPASSPALSPDVEAYVKVHLPAVALTHVRVIDGTGAAAREDQTVVIESGRITAAGDAGKVPVPEGAKTLDLSGDTVLPGLVGMHDHFFYPAPSGSAPESPGEVSLYHELGFSFPRLYLAAGVTTLRTTGSIEPYTDIEIKKKIDTGRIPGPAIRITGPYLEGAGAYTPVMHELTGPDDARRTVEFWADAGATSFKAYMNITRAELSAAVQAAHRRGLKITGHLCSIGFREAAALGIDNLEHGLVVDTEFVADKKPDVCPARKAVVESLLALDLTAAPAQEMIRDLVRRHVAVTSTLPVFETFVPNRPALAQRVMDALSPESRGDYLVTRARVADRADASPQALLRKEMDFERRFAEAGGLLLAGEDPTGYGGVLAGYGDQRGVELLVEAGFSPVEAIRIATSNGAVFLGEGGRIGTVAAGKQADLVVVKGDPSRRIEDIEKVEIVFRDGVGYDPVKLIDSVRGTVGLR